MIYRVESGVTLFMIALTVGRSVADLQAANCITNPDRIIAGTAIYVPRLPRFEPQNIRLPQGCQTANVRISRPTPNQRLRAPFEVFGTATGAEFAYYKLEIRADAATGYNFLSQSSTAVADGVLGQVDTNLFPPGLYWLRLAVVDTSANIAPGATCVIPMIFE